MRRNTGAERDLALPDSTAVTEVAVVHQTRELFGVALRSAFGVKRA